MHETGNVLSRADRQEPVAVVVDSIHSYVRQVAPRSMYSSSLLARKRTGCGKRVQRQSRGLSMSAHLRPAERDQRGLGSQKRLRRWAAMSDGDSALAKRAWGEMSMTKAPQGGGRGQELAYLWEQRYEVDWLTKEGGKVLPAKVALVQGGQAPFPFSSCPPTKTPPLLAAFRRCSAL